MAVELTINDVDKTTEIRASSIAVRMKTGERPTASFVSEARYSVGQKVGIFDDGTRRFGGTIDEIRNLAPVENAPYGTHQARLEYEYACTGWEHILDRRFTDNDIFGGHFFADSATDVITAYGHGLADGQRVRLASSDTLPAGLTAATTYFVRDVTADTFKLAATAGGAAINITSEGAGAHRFLWRSTDCITRLIADRTDDNITTSGVTDGPFVEKLAFAKIPLSEAIRQIADLATYVYWIDPDITLHFEALGSSDSGITIAGTSTAAFDLSVVRESREDYRNRQHVRVNNTVQQSQVFSGDDTTQLFWIDNRAAAIVRIYNNTTGEDFSFGIYGEDSDMGFYWAPGERLIVQDAAGAPIPTGESLIVIYQGIGDDVVTYDNTAEQTSRATIEGNSGIYERIVDAAALTREGGEDYASYLAGQFKIFKELTVRHKDTSFQPWHKVAIDLAAHDEAGPSNFFYIDSVILSVENGRMYSQVTVNDGFKRRASAEVFRSFQAGNAQSSASTGGGGGSSAAGGVSLDGVPVTY